ncbi:hypothetical protein NDU88_003391 [Pleurodeles waltl]|uniref:Uncharacterized protein n=1 Tax=Pleurodeles waltl TaxID=8319 RepID=A0AAV7SEE2_PLEWA|nr:hypothetical protein NDU88_003391 [Pleurodeles waltl]
MPWESFIGTNALPGPCPLDLACTYVGAPALTCTGAVKDIRPGMVRRRQGHQDRLQASKEENMPLISVIVWVLFPVLLMVSR